MILKGRRSSWFFGGYPNATLLGDPGGGWDQIASGNKGKHVAFEEVWRPHHPPHPPSFRDYHLHIPRTMPLAHTVNIVRGRLLSDPFWLTLVVVWHHVHAVSIGQF